MQAHGSQVLWSGVYDTMSAVMLSLKRIWKKALLLCLGGVALSVLMAFMRGSIGATFVSDLFFNICAMFFIAGLCGLVKNLGMFNSMKYGTRSLVNMFRGDKREEPEDKMVGGYLEYVRSRPKTKDVPWMMAFAGIFLALSVLASLPLR